MLKGPTEEHKDSQQGVPGERKGVQQVVPGDHKGGQPGVPGEHKDVQRGEQPYRSQMVGIPPDPGEPPHIAHWECQEGSRPWSQ